jgi:hypothetical protein
MSLPLSRGKLTGNQHLPDLSEPDANVSPNHETTHGHRGAVERCV